METQVSLRPSIKVVWEPSPGSQSLALDTRCHHTLYHGTRGPGKTITQLMRFRRRVGIGYGAYWRGVIFDLEFDNLADLVAQSKRFFPLYNDGAKFHESHAAYKWVWPTGEELLFRHVKKIDDYNGFHGHEYPFIGWNELTKFASSELYDKFMSCNRSSFLPNEHPVTIDGDIFNATGQIVLLPATREGAVTYTLPEIPLEVFSTTNPHGPGHNWVKRRFIDAAPAGRVVRTETIVFNPRTQKEEPVVKTQVAIFGSYRENRYLSPEYIATLDAVEDPNTRRAWLLGDWDVTAGGMFDDLWNKAHHVVKPFDIPSSWRIDRSYDHGESKPFSVGWWAESDGSDVKLPDGSYMSTVRGDLFRINEWYGWSGKENVGLRMLATDIAAGIVKREIDWKLYGKVAPGPADNSIWDVENGNSIAADMARDIRLDGKLYGGVQWARSDKSPGSRKAGWKQMRQRLKNALPQYKLLPSGQRVRIPRENPGIFIFDTCKMFISLVPSLPRDPKDMDDVQTDAEDHIGDEARYRCLASNMGARSGKTKGL